MSQTAAQVSDPGTVAYMAPSSVIAAPAALATAVRPRGSVRAGIEAAARTARGAAALARRWASSQLPDTLAVVAAFDASGYVHAPSCATAAAGARRVSLRELERTPQRYGQCNTCDDKLQTTDARVTTAGLLGMVERELAQAEASPQGFSLADLLWMQRNLQRARSHAALDDASLERFADMLEQRVARHLARLDDARWLLNASAAAAELADSPDVPATDAAGSVRSALRSVASGASPEVTAATFATADPDGRWLRKLLGLARRSERSAPALLVTETNVGPYAAHHLTPAIQRVYPTWHTGRLTVTEAPEELVGRVVNGREAEQLGLHTVGEDPRRADGIIELAWDLRGGAVSLTEAYATAALLRPPLAA